MAVIATSKWLSGVYPARHNWAEILMELTEISQIRSFHHIYPLHFTSGAGAPFQIKKLREHLRWADAQTAVTKHLMSAIRTSLSKGVTGRALVQLVSNTTLGLGLRSGLRVHFSRSSLGG